MLVLVSGSQFSAPGENSPSTHDFICGAFLRLWWRPVNDEDTTTEFAKSFMFALEPLHYSSEVRQGTVESTRVEGKEFWKIRVKAGKGAVSTLSVRADGTATRVSLGVGSQGKVGFIVKRIEVLVLKKFRLWPAA